MKISLRSLALFLIFSLTSITSAQAEQTPWQIASGPAWLMMNLNWPNYNAGFDFTPNADGVITSLGGLFNGKKTVRLYHTATGELMSQVEVTGDNTWQYVQIPPLSVAAGTRYTVAVNTGWTGATMSYGMGFPVLPYTIGDITIERSVFSFGAQMPTWEIWNQMWGQPDIGFNACEVCAMSVQ